MGTQIAHLEAAIAKGRVEDTERVSEMVRAAKESSVIRYDVEARETDATMRYEITDFGGDESAKRRRDVILWTRFVRRYRECVNGEFVEFAGATDVSELSFDASQREHLRALNQ